MSEIGAYKAVTFQPKHNTFIQGAHDELFPRNPTLLASMKDVTDYTQDEFTRKYETRILNARMASVANSLAANKHRVMMGQLTAADFEAGRDNLDHLILIRLYQQLMGKQERWFHLDNMFNAITMDKLLMRMSFKTNPAAAQTVGRREEYDVTKVEYDEINFDLPKVVVSYDIALEDPLRALIDPISPLKDNNEYSMAYHREKEAAAALGELRYHYTKSATTNKARFSATAAPANTAAARISDPRALATGNFHSDHKSVNELQDMRNYFMEEFDMFLTHGACSPRVAMALAQNTWTQPNTINNVEAYRTTGGVRPFPGLADMTMVISQILPDNVIYFASKPNNALVKAEGPKITKMWEDNDHWTSRTAMADFHQYKCCHEDLTIDRRFGVIVDLQN